MRQHDLDLYYSQYMGLMAPVSLDYWRLWTP